MPGKEISEKKKVPDHYFRKYGITSGSTRITPNELARPTEGGRYTGQYVDSLTREFQHPISAENR
jgi:hypothetical protein